MSKFFFEDTCAFKADPAIIGTVERTWSNVDSSSEGLLDCYVHKDLPVKVRKGWFDEEKLTPGFVIIAFMQDCDGYCLVSESSLQLIDRSLAAGDVVKKRLSDTQSGTVIATSLMCSLQSLCSESEFLRKHHPLVQGHTPSHGPHAPKRARRKATTAGPKLVHGFPAPNSHGPNGIAPLGVVTPPLLQVPASELKFWNTYREEDHLIYKGWIGVVGAIYDEVTIRLANGSVVVVEDPEELEEPYWIHGTPSYELAQRLDRAGYYQYSPRKHAPGVGKPQSIPAEPCYPGQHVQTKKGNLRCGRWKAGAYDPNITPRGIVVDVRILQIEVRWLCSTTSVAPPLPPSTLLGVEELESGEIVVYDQSKLPKQPVASILANASYSPDTGFGHNVRFKDPTGAAVKYGPHSEGATHTSSMPIFDHIPPAATQGFDMNVLRIVATSTKVTICWQDCSATEEDSTQLFPYSNPDENDVWPGDKVSFLPDEEKLGDDVPIIRLHKVGVVQSVDARERIARVRWFEGTEIDIDEEEKASQYSASKYGKLRDEIAEVPLYDIAAHEALAMNRGDLVLVAPELQALSPAHVDGGEDLGPLLPVDLDGDVDMLFAHSSSLPFSRVAEPSPPFNPGFFTAPFQRARMFLGLASGEPGLTPQDSPLSQATEWIGGVTDLCLDGEVVVRLGAASKVRDIKVPIERVIVIAPANTDSSQYSSTEDDGESDLSDAMSVSNEETDRETDQESVKATDVSVEYEGGEKMNDDDDEGMWDTDEENDGRLDKQRSHDHDDQRDQRLASEKDDFVQLDGGVVQEPPNISSFRANTPRSLSSYSSMPSRFSVLEGRVPTDHHYFGSSRPLTAELMRRVMNEHRIMQSSLPDGIFVRTWESRLDLLRVLIVGPFDTPYEFAPFVVDLQFGSTFPTSSPDAFFHSWTGGSGRINPNLYEDGKICLSLLGTWDADEPSGEWSSKKSTVLQIFVSLMGLVLVKEPYYS